MRLVDDQILDRRFEWAVVLPVEVVEGEAAAMVVGIGPVRLHAPGIPPADDAGIGIEENLGLIEPLPIGGIERAIHAVAVFEQLDVEIEDHHRPDIADAKLVRKGNLGERLRLALLEEDEGALGGEAREDREIHATRHGGRPEGERLADTELEAREGVRGMNIDAVQHGTRFLSRVRDQAEIDATASATVSWTTKNLRKPVTDIVSLISSTTAARAILPPAPVIWR